MTGLPRSDTPETGLTTGFDHGCSDVSGRRGYVREHMKVPPLGVEYGGEDPRGAGVVGVRPHPFVTPPSP